MGRGKGVGARQGEMAGGHQAQGRSSSRVDDLLSTLQQDKARRQSKQRAATELRLHRTSEQREMRRNELLHHCFQKKSRWGGLAFTWEGNSFREKPCRSRNDTNS